MTSCSPFPSKDCNANFKNGGKANKTVCMLSFYWKNYVKFAAGGLFAALAFLACEIFLFFPVQAWFFYKIFKDKRPIRFTLIDGFIYWLFFFIGNLYWLVYPLTLDLKSHGILIPFAIVAIPSYLAVQLLLPIYLTKKYFKGVWTSALVFSISTFSAMYFYGHCAPGFPWVLPGYVLSDNIFTLQAFSIWGIYGQTLITLLLGNILGVWYYQTRRKQNPGLAFAILWIVAMAFIAFGEWRIFDHKTEYTNYKVRSVQGSIYQKDKMDRNLRDQNLSLYLDLSKIKSKKYKEWNPDFVIWPEASVPYLFQDNAKVLRKKLSSAAFENGYFISGVVRKDSLSGFVYNSVVVLDESGEKIATYDKRHLVPFGEYVPCREFIPKIFSSLANTIGDFDVGQTSNIIDIKGLKIVFAICYEAIFPRELISKNQVGDVIVNTTNDAWFGHTSELTQHLRIVKCRAVEEGLPLIRVTNFGISAVFDAYGRKIESLGVNEVGVMDFYIPKKCEETIYRKMLSFL